MTQMEKAGGTTHPAGSQDTLHHQHTAEFGEQLDFFRGQQQRERPPVLGKALLAASADPASSALAAAEITANGTRQSRKAAVLAALQSQGGPATSLELANSSGLCRFAIARALPDLEHDSLAKRHPMRVCRAGGRLCITWTAAEVT